MCAAGPSASGVRRARTRIHTDSHTYPLPHTFELMCSDVPVREEQLRNMRSGVLCDCDVRRSPLNASGRSWLMVMACSDHLIDDRSQHRPGLGARHCAGRTYDRKARARISRIHDGRTRLLTTDTASTAAVNEKHTHTHTHV